MYQLTQRTGHLSVGESQLPSGPPSQKGVGLDEDLPGGKTFSKPEEDIREPEKNDESIYRVDDADDLLKDQTKEDEIDHSEAHPSYNGLGDYDGYGKTKYPYRDGIPNRHNASLVQQVAEMWLSTVSPERTVDLTKKVLVATRITDIEQGLNPKVVDRSRSCSVSLKRADVVNLRWIFSVDCGNGPKVVRVKASRKGSVVQITKMDLLLSCSCPAWRWLGSEYHAKGSDYLNGKPVGTASTPDIKDPSRHNKVCKHVASVLNFVRKWSIPLRKKFAEAIHVRACNVCEAIRALEATQADPEVGYKVPYLPGTYVRARGSGAEFKAAEFQIRVEGQPWPNEWIPSKDLAGSLMDFGITG